MAELLTSALTAGLDRLVRGGLRGVWLDGVLPEGPFVWAANHHSWWDPFVAAAVLRRSARPASLLMRQDNLERYRFAHRLGVFGTGQLRNGLRYLEQGRVLVVYPEGELRPAAALGPLATGAAWFAARAAVPLAAVAVRVVLRGHQAPEAYLRLRPVAVTLDAHASTDHLTRELHDGLSMLDRALAAADPRAPLTGFEQIVAGRRSWDERIDALGRSRRWWRWD